MLNAATMLCYSGKSHKLFFGLAAWRENCGQPYLRRVAYLRKETVFYEEAIA
jgi:hypothetical protein